MACKKQLINASAEFSGQTVLTLLMAFNEVTAPKQGIETSTPEIVLHDREL